jgi:hypothetical protein
MNLGMLQGPDEIQRVLLLRKDLGKISVENIVEFMRQEHAKSNQ